MPRGNNSDMSDLIGFVDYGFEDVIIPPAASMACLAAIQRWSGCRFDGLIGALDGHHHLFEPTADGALRLDWIKLDAEWPDLERFYKVLAPFLLPGGLVWCADEEQHHLCYQFTRSRVFRVEGRVIYDGRSMEL